jgi:glycosyltransferase involved in cell wall biosynthesis
MKQIDDLMREGKLESFGENAIRMAKENFDWNVIAKKLLEAYEISE